MVTVRDKLVKVQEWRTLTRSKSSNSKYNYSHRHQWELHAHHFWGCDTHAGLGQIVLADIFNDLLEKTLWLVDEVVLHDNQCYMLLAKTKEQKAFKAINMPMWIIQLHSVLLILSVSFKWAIICYLNSHSSFERGDVFKQGQVLHFRLNLVLINFNQMFSPAKIIITKGEHLVFEGLHSKNVW